MMRGLIRLRNVALPALLLSLAACGSSRTVPIGKGTRVHTLGILNRELPSEWHGSLLAQVGWRFESCTVCHGTDFAGTAVAPSCLRCHKNGPTTCDTCHGSQLGDAHPAHLLGTSQGKTLTCAECHPMPKDFRDPGHLYEADGSPRTAPLRIQFGTLAGLSAPRGIRLPAPGYVAAERACENVYCHGAPFGDAAATWTRPTWQGDGTQASCGTCHGLPPKSHDSAQHLCVKCHNRTVDAGNKLLAAGLHLNGRVDVGDGSGSCTACHGSPASIAPPFDVSRNSDVSAIGVGVHQSHLQATHRLRGAMTCSDCHLVPSSITSPGHISADQSAPVFPSTPSFVSVAQADGAIPRWDRVTQRCSDVYCHGGGRKLSLDSASGLLKNPLWTQTGQAYCGACHGIPPRDAAHVSTLRLVDCVNCHPATMDAAGTLLVTGFPGAESSAHINGVIDVR